MTIEEVVACHHCDLLMDSPQINAGEYARCPRCHHKITRFHHNAINSLFSFAVTGLILLLLTTQFDLLILNLNGNISELDLWDGANQLYFDDYKILSILIILFIFVLPILFLTFIVLFILSIKTGIGCGMQTTLLRLVFSMMPWVMVEVFLVAILVSIVKLVSIGQLNVGWAFWIYAVFCFCYVKVLSLVDRYQFWHWIDEAHQ